MIDQKIKNLLELEKNRQNNCVNLIASENFVSDSVMELTGSILTNKYTEGYPHKRYYGGCEYYDEIELLAQKYLKKLFDCNCNAASCKKANFHANVQPHSGSQANAAAYYAVMQPGDTLLGMNLNEGGHLTHGHKASFSSRFYKSISYGLDQNNVINYEEIRKLAHKHRPKVIIAGASSYPFKINFAKFREIADEVGAIVIADIAHIAGLIIGKVHPNPVCHVDIITSTTHKTLRGPRGGIILCTEEFKNKIDSAVFPGNQGGPIMNTIAAKAQSFFEAMQPDFKEYQKNIIKNSKIMSDVFKEHNVKLIGDTSENHLLIIDTKASFNLTGAEAEAILQQINIICNKNSIPNDKESPRVTSGIRLGTPAMTTKNWEQEKFKKLTLLIIKALTKKESKVNLLKDVQQLLK